MSDAKQRVEQELADLEDRIGKLHAFLCSDKLAMVKPIQQQLLAQQYEVMDQLASILVHRLQNW
jgi:hypothetical protein